MFRFSKYDAILGVRAALVNAWKTRSPRFAHMLHTMTGNDPIHERSPAGTASPDGATAGRVSPGRNRAGSTATDHVSPGRNRAGSTAAQGATAEPSAPDGAEGASPSTPLARVFSVLEAMTRLGGHFTLQDMVQETGFPKPSVYRHLQQLELAGIVQRDGDDRHYLMGSRLRDLANGLLLNDSLHGARHRILLRLREQVGESCNLTALSGGEVMYLDRVETEAPLRIYLHPGSRVPVHASATGKLFLGQMPPRQRQLLLGQGTLQAFTPNTLTDPAALEAEIARCRKQGYSVDHEEFLPGMICLAVLVPRAHGPACLGLAMQGPAMRLSAERAAEFLPALREAARALAALEAPVALPS